MQSSKYLIIFCCKCFYPLIIYWPDWQALHSDMKKRLLTLMSSTSHFSGCKRQPWLALLWFEFALAYFFFFKVVLFSHLTCNSSWVFLFPSFGHDSSFQKDVFLLLITSHTLLFSCTGFLFHFLKSLFRYVACICSQPPAWYLCLPYCLGRFNSLSFFPITASFLLARFNVSSRVT